MEILLTGAQKLKEVRVKDTKIEEWKIGQWNKTMFSASELYTLTAKSVLFFKKNLCKPLYILRNT